MAADQPRTFALIIAYNLLPIFQTGDACSPVLPAPGAAARPPCLWLGRPSFSTTLLPARHAPILRWNRAGTPRTPLDGDHLSTTAQQRKA